MIKRFRYVVSDRNEMLKLNLDEEDNYLFLPIIWNRNGLYKIIPVALIKNMVSVIRDAQKHYSEKQFKPNFAVLYWYNGINIDANSARLLLEE